MFCNIKGFGVNPVQLPMQDVTWFKQVMNLSCELNIASDIINLNHNMNAEGKIISIVKQLGADYINLTGGRDLYKEQNFKKLFKIEYVNPYMVH